MLLPITSQWRIQQNIELKYLPLSGIDPKIEKYWLYTKGGGARRERPHLLRTTNTFQSPDQPLKVAEVWVRCLF